MSSAAGFQPNWASPPGETILKILERKGFSKEFFAKQVDLSLGAIGELIIGKHKINPELASKLEVTLGPSSDFWISREAQYRADVQWLLNEGATQENVEWLKDIPFKDMIKFGWIEERENKEDIATACLDFFEIKNLESWYEDYLEKLKCVAFRTSYSFESDSAAVATWLRKGEIEGKKIECKNWNAQKFKSALENIRQLSRIKDPNVFIPQLQNLCSDCGVAVVIVRAPKGCRASGATYFLKPNKAIVQLSFRYKSDDHFWFTFFHEAGHLLLHSNQEIFLEGSSVVTTKEEEEANEFSGNILIPEQYQNELYGMGSYTFKQVMRYARRIGVSPGIVVGQLQHRRIIEKSRLNFLKVRYSWE